MNKQTVIDLLQLEKLTDPAGGYYRRTYNSPHTVSITKPDGSTVQRKTMTSIFFLLTTDSKIGYMHKNKCDIVLYYQLGLPTHCLLLHPDGTLEENVLGPDILVGHKLQVFVPGDSWVATALKEDEVAVAERDGDRNKCDFGLTSEAASPGFEYCDMTMATEDMIKSPFPDHWEKVKPFVLSCTTGTQQSS